MKYLVFFLLTIMGSLFLLSSCEEDDDNACTELTWYQDADGDGFGNPDVSFDACEAPTGYVANFDDDNDICSGVIDVCGVCDGLGELTWYEDADGDGLGNPAVSEIACEQPEGYVADNTDTNDSDIVIDVDGSYFTNANANITVTKIPCTLSDGTETECYQIVTNSTPTDHQMGPWCPDNISDDASAGGIWLENGEVHDVDGAFVENMATFYNDATWQMYDANGDIYVTETEQDCINAANPNVGDEYKNFCVECLPSYITDISQTFLIPVTPVLQNTAVYFAMGPGGPGSTAPSTRGIALNGVEYSAPAPTNNILSAYTLAPFDDAGGHINVNQGYHYHAATGLSFSIAQSDGHAPLVGYAMDGHGIYSLLDENGNEASDLDACRGHFDDIRGYHYHVDEAGNNNFINCLQGAYPN